jgi:HPt (histidine-containing phosphotransfer) domain-containing protein
MSFEQALSTSLAAAVGEDPALVAELQTAFVESARRHHEAILRAGTDAEWREAALRMKGLAASFGATALMVEADRAATARRGDSASLQALERSVALLVF